MNIDFKRNQLILIFFSTLILSIAIRIVFLPFQTGDLTTFVLKWYDTLLKVGRIDALRTDFYNYSPAYIYLIDIMTLFLWIPKLVAIKLISIFFDFIAAIAVFKLVGINNSSQEYKWIGFFVMLFLPAVFIESSLWGQTDIIYTTFLLWSLYFILKNKPAVAMISFSIGLCFKAQAVFFLPVLLILFLHRKIKFYWFFIVPVIYIISVTPVWILGRPIYDLLTIYIRQAETYNQLSMRAPNPYIFLNSEGSFELKVWIGIGITAIISLTYVLLRWLKWKRIDVYTICFDTAFFTTLLPFILPKMHERYFFAGGIFLLIMAFYNPKQIPAAILMQASLLISFIPYFSGWTNNWVKIAAIINTVGMILFLYFGHELFIDHDFRRSIYSKEKILE